MPIRYYIHKPTLIATELLRYSKTLREILRGRPDEMMAGLLLAAVSFGMECGLDKDAMLRSCQTAIDSYSHAKETLSRGNPHN